MGLPAQLMIRIVVVPLGPVRKAFESGSSKGLAGGPALRRSPWLERGGWQRANWARESIRLLGGSRSRKPRARRSALHRGELRNAYGCAFEAALPSPVRRTAD